MSDKLRNGKPRPHPSTVGKLDDATHQKIVDTVAAGCAMETAAAYAGVNSWTFKDWLRKGRTDREHGRHNKHTRLVDAIEQARAGAEAGRIARVAAAGVKGEWQADAWWLERTFPDRYGKRTRVDGTVQVQALPMIDPARLTLNEARELRRLLEKARPSPAELGDTGRAAAELMPGEVMGEVVAETDEAA